MGRNLQDLIDAITAIDTAGIVSAIQAVETDVEAIATDLANLERRIDNAIIMSCAFDDSPYVAFGSQVCDALEVVNTTGKTVGVMRNNAGNVFQMPDGTAKVFDGIANANEISCANLTDNASVTVYAEALIYA